MTEEVFEATMGVAISMTKVIHSANDSGLTCLVDDEDYDLNQHRWHICPGRYAHCWATMKALHKLVAERMGLVGRIDHINRNKLDNRRENLRLATRSQNAANNGPTSRNSSGYRGVKPENGRWSVEMAVYGKPTHVGAFDSLEEAAIAYDMKAREVYGEHAHVNVPNPDPVLVEHVKAKTAAAKQHKGVSRYHGVTFDKRPGPLQKRWVAQARHETVPRGSKALGRYLTEEEAAQAVDDELDRRGSTHKRNFPKTPSL